MAVLVSCHNIRKVFGTRTLFTNLSFTVNDGERFGLIGPNGSGKSTLMELLAGTQEPDGGAISWRKQTRMAYVPQDSVFPPGLSVAEVMHQTSPPGIEDREVQIRMTLSRMGFPDFEAQADGLSGGWKKRLSIASQIIGKPDLLLLDEPTNHLDLETIIWLEEMLANAPFASITISHDRYFLENMATDVAEINRVYPEGIFVVKGPYSTFLERRDEFMQAQAKLRESLDIRVRREVEWLRRGAKARTTKSKARIQTAGQLIDQRDELVSRTRTASAGIDFATSDRRTKRLVMAEGISKTLGGKKLFDGLDFTLMAGMRLGLVGPNGSGKTTLMRLIQGELEPDSGSVERAANLQVVNFAQNRALPDFSWSLRRTLAPDGDSVMFRGKPIHAASWAKRFLFTSEQLDMPVGSLSGGERARVLIARLMLETADILLLDEPTNDLDIPTLEVLEENLTDFPGALVLVTHDRYLLDTVSTQVLGLDGLGNAGVFADYFQWDEWASANRKARIVSKSVEPAAVATPEAPVAKRKLSYKEQREWETIEVRILEAEAAVSQCEADFAEAAAAGDGARLRELPGRLDTAKAAVDALYARWSELSEVAGG